MLDLVTAAAAPDVVIVGPCGYGLEAAKEQAREIEHLLPAHFGEIPTSLLYRVR